MSRAFVSDLCWFFAKTENTNADENRQQNSSCGQELSDFSRNWHHMSFIAKRALENPQSLLLFQAVRNKCKKRNSTRKERA